MGLPFLMLLLNILGSLLKFNISLMLPVKEIYKQ